MTSNSRQGMMKRMAACGLVAAMLGVATSNASACKFKQRPWDDLVQAAEVVFEGTVRISSNDRSGQKPDRAAIFVMEKVLKGPLKQG